MSQSLRVLFATSEIYPLVKTGGLADVSAALPAALRRIRQARAVAAVGRLANSTANH